MANAWSFLSDELNMSNQDYWEEDGFSIVGNPLTASASPDTISFSSTTSLGGAADTLSLYDYSGQDSMSFDLNLPPQNDTNITKRRFLKNSPTTLVEHTNSTILLVMMPSKLLTSLRHVVMVKHSAAAIS